MGYSVEVSNTNKASVKMLADGRFSVKPKTDGIFFLTVEYNGISKRFEFRDDTIIFGNVIRLVNSKGQRKKKNDTIDLKVGKAAAYNVELVDETLEGYTIEVSDEHMADIEFSKDGKFTIVPKKTGTYYLSIIYKGSIEEYKCRNTFGLQSLWQALRNFFSSAFGS